MKTYMPLNGLRWSRNSGSANCDMPQSAVFGRPGGWYFMESTLYATFKLIWHETFHHIEKWH